MFATLRTWVEHSKAFAVHFNPVLALCFRNKPVIPTVLMECKPSKR